MSFETLLHWKPQEEKIADNAHAHASDLIPEFADLIDENRSKLRIGKQKENELLASIDELRNTERIIGGVSFQRFFDQSIARINDDFDHVESSAIQLTSSLHNLSGLAQNISERVAILDMGKNRVVECLQRVNDLKDLGISANAVEDAIKRGNYEDAARHIHRFLTLDSAVFKMGDHPEAKDASYSVANCYDVLRRATVELKEIIEQKFDEAKSRADIAMMERFFKLFPLINEHRSGLCRFGSYLCDKIAELGEQYYKIMQAGGTDDSRSNVLFADTLTMIFEGSARLIELNQTIIADCYGPEKLLDLIEIIQPECDKQTARILDAFLQKRNFDEKASQVARVIQSQNTGADSQTVKIDAIELDLLLSEVTLMHTRAELFWRFLRRRLNRTKDGANQVEIGKVGLDGGRAGREGTLEDGVEFESEEERKDYFERVKRSAEERARKLDSVLNRSGLNMKMHELLGKYVLMEQFYMIQSVQKAISMDAVEEGAITSSLLDDVFFIIRKSIRRSISSSSVDCICAMINNGVTLLETDFLKYIFSSIKSGYPTIGWTAEAYQTAQNAYSAVLQQGKGMSEIAGIEKQRSTFLIGLNNLRASIQCVHTLKEGLAEDFQKHLSQMSATEGKKIENAVSQLDDFAKRLEQHANLGVGKLCEAVFRPKLKTSVEEYLEIPHVVSEEKLAEFEFDDPFIGNFIAQLDKQIVHFEPLLETKNYKALVNLVCAEAIHHFERIIFKCSFNRLGAFQLDKEFRELTSYFTSISSWDVREKCSHFSQIIALLNSENLGEAIALVEQTQTNAMLASSILSQNDIRRTLNLREEFRRDEINAKLALLSKH